LSSLSTTDETELRVCVGAFRGIDGGRALGLYIAKI
jgi:hypothetical protein